MKLHNAEHSQSLTNVPPKRARTERAPTPARRRGSIRGAWSGTCGVMVRCRVSKWLLLRTTPATLNGSPISPHFLRTTRPRSAGLETMSRPPFRYKTGARSHSPAMVLAIQWHIRCKTHRSIQRNIHRRFRRNTPHNIASKIRGSPRRRQGRIRRNRRWGRIRHRRCRHAIRAVRFGAWGFRR